MTAHAQRSRAQRRGIALGVFVLAGLLLGWIGFAFNRDDRRTDEAGGVPESDRLTAAIDSLSREGFFLDATALGEQQLRSLRRESGASIATAECLERLGKLQFDQGVYTEANRCFREALLLRRSLQGPKSFDVAHTLNLLGRTEKTQGLTDSSRAHYEAGREIARELGGPRHPLVGESLSGLAGFLRWDPAKRPLAAETLRDALDMRRKGLGEDAPGTAATEIDLGLVLLQLGQNQEARQLLEHALGVRRRQFGPDHPELAVTLSLYAMSLFREGRLEQAEQIYRECGRSYERVRQHTPRGLNRLRFRPMVQESLAATLLEEGKLDEAWPALERGLATYMSEVLTPGGTSDPAFPLARIQTTLTPREALIGWVAGSVADQRIETLWGFVIRNSGPVHWARLEVLPSMTRKESFAPRPMELLREFGSTAGWPARVPASEKLLVLGQRVWEERLAPLEQWLDGVDVLIVTSSSSMLSLPLEALADGEARSLSERFAVAYAPSATTFALLRERSLAHPPIGRRRALLLADPPFTEEQLAEMNRRPKGIPAESLLASVTLPSAESMTGALRGDHSALRLLPRLSWSRGEATEIAAMIPHSTLLLGADASERKLRALAAGGGLRRYDTLHFASHALRDPRLPGLAALVLSQVDVDRPDSTHRSEVDGPYLLGKNDGLLLTEEFAQFPLDADLVVLSGCTTFGYPQFGAVDGLGSGFLQAGARTLVVSLWRVEDRATSLLMTQFYRNLTLPLPKVEALRRAKLWLRDYEDADGSHPYAHPAYWSPFILIGDPGE